MRMQLSSAHIAACVVSLLMGCLRDHFDLATNSGLLFRWAWKSSSILVAMYKCIIVTNWKVHNKLSCYYGCKHCFQMHSQNCASKIFHIWSHVFSSQYGSVLSFSFVLMWSRITCAGLLFSLLLWMFWLSPNQTNSTVLSYICLRRERVLYSIVSTSLTHTHTHNHLHCLGLCICLAEYSSILVEK